MAGDLDWLTEDICDVVALSRPENNKKHLSEKVRLAKLGRDDLPTATSQASPNQQAYQNKK